MSHPNVEKTIIPFEVLQIITPAEKTKNGIENSSKEKAYDEKSEDTKNSNVVKKTTAYSWERSENGQKSLKKDGEKAGNGLGTAIDCLKPIGNIATETDKKCERALLAYLANKKVHQVILNKVQKSESDADYELFIMGISKLVEHYKNNKLISLKALTKTVSENNEKLSIRFLTDHVSPILEAIGIIRRQSENKFRWASYHELSKMVVAATKKSIHQATKKNTNVHVQTDVQKEENVQMDVQEHDVHVQTGVIGWINRKIRESNERALEVRKNKAIEAAKQDPWKKVHEDGTIEDIVIEPTDEDKELYRKNELLKKRMEVISENHQMESADYVATYSKTEADHNLKVQRELHRAQTEMVTMNLEKMKARNEKIQKAKDGTFRFVKIALMFIAAIAFIATLKTVVNMTTNDQEVAEEYAPW